MTTALPSDRHAHRILIIDDNQAIHADFRKILGPRLAQFDELDAMEALLFQEGESPPADAGPAFTLDSALQGQEGVALARRARDEGRPYSLAFVDVRMPPGLDGIETTALLWQDDSDLQVVLCTAYSDYSWDETVKRLGASDRLLILKKPFDAVEVRQLACALTAKWLLQHQARHERTELESIVAHRTAELSTINEQLRREMTLREQVEVELRHSQKLEAVGQLAAGIAHEINTPIQFIGDNVHFLRDAFSDLLAPAAERDDADMAFLAEHVPRAFERALEGIERVAKIVDAMKEFAHLDQKEKAHADINKLIESTLIVARNEYKYVAEVTTELGTLPTVPCIAGDLNQVFLNLIVNAAHAISDVVKGTAQRGLIRVVTRPEERGGVRISISDSGSGIPEAARSRIFDPFFTTKEIGRGTGQGLTISRSIVVDRHGGSISFETEVGRGTTFHIWLPA